MTVRWNIKKATTADRGALGEKKGRDVVTASDACAAAEPCSADVSLDLGADALRRAGLSSAGPIGGQAVPSVRVMGLLGQMQQIAMRCTSRELSGDERSAMADDMVRLADKIDAIADGLTRAVPRGEIPANYDSVEAFFESVFADETLDGLLDPFSSYSLGVDSRSISVRSPDASRMALNSIADAMSEMKGIHRNGASTEAHLDAALERLAAFVDSIDPDAEVPHSPDAALQSAERIRLYLMSGQGISALGQSENLQKSVTALLQ